jgi:hypothetical protein
MNDKEIDRLIREALSHEHKLPQGLSGRLEQHIDQLATDEEKMTSPGRKRSLHWLSGIAATLLLGVTIFFQVEKKQVPSTMADTFSNPQEAALVAQHALALLSTRLNKGLEQIAEAGEEINRVNTIVNKQFEVLGVQP